MDDAARAAALSTQTKVKIDFYGKSRDGISVATLAEVGFAYMKMFGATKIAPEPDKPQGYEETGSVSSAIRASASARIHRTRRVIRTRWNRTRSARLGIMVLLLQLKR